MDILKNKQEIIDSKLFTKNQVNIISKRMNNKPLNSNEKTYFYKFISPRIRAIKSMMNIEDYNITGDIIRKEQAVNLIKKECRKAIISGSYLYEKKYNDIDVFIFSKYKKDDKKHGRIHYTYLNSLDSLFVASIFKISVANFIYKPSFSIKLEDVLQKYELLMNSILQKEEHTQELRDFLLYSEYYFNNIILSPKELNFLKDKYIRKDSKFITNTFINMLAVNLDMEKKKILIMRTSNYEKLKEYHSDNVKLYLKTYKQAIALGS